MQNETVSLENENISSHCLESPSTAPPRKRRRVSLACRSCRERKSRCNGQRPSCSPCLELGIHCIYEEASGVYRSPRGIKPANGHAHLRAVNRCIVSDEGGETAQLRLRVRELEARLRSVSVAPPIIPLNEKGTEQINSLPASSMRRRPDLGARSAPVPLTTPSTDIGQATDEVQVDTLATATFDDVPEGTDRDIGNFGPTSNHALFRTLSGIFAHVVHIFSPSKQQHCTASSARDYHGFARPLPLSLPVRRLKISGDTPDVVDIWALPDDQDIILLINQFSATVGIVLPFVNTSTILSEYKRRQENNQQLPRPMQALLNIICAHTSSTLQSTDAKLHYHRAIALLDEQTLRGSCLELIQALLLIAIFQQNHQRSIASWTFHAVAVKAAFQLGLHSPIYYEDHAFQESELRKRLWYALVNQDRYLSISLGRPCMIPQQHIQVEVPRDASLILQSMPMTMPEQIDSLLYFNRVISLDTVKSSIIESLYNHNIDSEPLPLQELLIKRLQLSWQLEQWRQNTASFCDILSEVDLCQRSRLPNLMSRLQVLLSIQYYSVTLLINGPVLTKFLSEWVKKKESARDKAILIESMVPVIKNELEIAKELLMIIDGATTCGESFLECNAAWWKCNYIMFTVNLHLFGILLACKCHGGILTTVGVLEMVEVRSSLDRGLKILQTFERISLMSRKAGHCILGFLKVFDSLASDLSPTIPFSTAQAEVPATPAILDPSWMIAEDISLMPQNLFSQYIAQSADTFLFQCSDAALLDGDLNFL